MCTASFVWQRYCQVPIFLTSPIYIACVYLDRVAKHVGLILIIQDQATLPKWWTHPHASMSNKDWWLGTTADQLELPGAIRPWTSLIIITQTRWPTMTAADTRRRYGYLPYYKWRRYFWQSFSLQGPPHRHIYKIKMFQMQDDTDSSNSQPQLEARLQPHYPGVKNRQWMFGPETNQHGIKNKATFNAVFTLLSQTTTV